MTRRETGIALIAAALVAADAALRRGLCDADQLTRAVDRAKGYTGIEAIRAAIVALDSDQDKRLARGLVEHGDFVEGVRAQLVDKDRSPSWRPAACLWKRVNSCGRSSATIRRGPSCPSRSSAPPSRRSASTTCR